MKQNKDWTDVMRSALRDAEVTPPADGWARLERELKTPAPRISVLRRYWPRIAAAAVLIFVGGGELLLHENRSLGDKGFVIASATDGQQTGCIAVVQLTPGRIFPLSAPFGQYLFLHFHICVHSYKWYKDQKTARDQKKF